MMRTPRLFIVIANLALCLGLALSFTATGLADQPPGDGEETQILLPVVFKDRIPFIESTGVLDTSFDGDGWALANFGGSNEKGYAAVLQPDGKLVAAGYANLAVTSFALARYNLDGSLDASFGRDGLVTLDFDGQGAIAQAILLQPDGKLVVAGYITTYLGKDFALARFNPDGSLDPTFSGDGMLQTDFDTRGDRAYAVALDPASGKIVAAGCADGTYGPDFALARYLPDGSLDTTFSSDGMLVTDFDDHEDEAVAVLVQPGDGKIVAAGSSRYADEIYGYSDIALARYNPDGSPDTSFSTDGKVTATLGGYGYNLGQDVLLLSSGSYVVAGTTYTAYAETKSDFSLAYFTDSGSLDHYALTDFDGENDAGATMTLQGDDKIVVAGYTEGATDYDIALARYDLSGSLDTTFGVEGRQVIDTGNYDRAYAVVARPGGPLVVVGAALNPFFDFAVLQLTAAGALDSSFAEDGIQFTEFAGSPDDGYAAALQPDGKLVAAGRYYPGVPFFGLARFNPDGSLDTSFDGDGLVSGYMEGGYARDVAIQPDGKIVAVGNTSGSDFITVRFNADGSLDTTFAGDGMAVTDIAGDNDYAEAVLLQADGKIVVAGTGSADFALVRYLPDGSLDPGFDGDGKLSVEIGFTSYAFDAALQLDGKILIAGLADYSFGLARLNPDGSLDATFSGDGMVTTGFGGDTSIADAIAVQPDGKIVAAGYIAASPSEYIAMARYNPDGSLDTSFSGDGMLTLDFTGGADMGRDLAIQPNGKILLAGVTYGASPDYALLRLNPDGSLDPSFSSGGLLGIDFTGGFDQGYALALMPDGRILVAGYASNGLDYDFAVVRLK
jgi:uncharacterized delta-60 repeat protein